MQIEMGKLMTSIDFGSAKTVLAVGQKQEDGIHIVFWKSAPSEGVKYGEIYNITRCSRVLKGLIDEAQEVLGESITEACVSISGRKIESSDEKVSIDRALPGTSISLNEIKDMTLRQYNASDNEKVILEVAPQQYNIDDQYNVSFDELEGMRGKSLDACYKLFKGKKLLLESREQVLQQCGIRLSRCIFSPVASARAVLTEQEREKGVVVIDFGKDLTEIAIVRNDSIRDAFVLPFAGEAITRDIENVTECSMSWAELVKVRHGYCLEEICPENKTLELINADGEDEGGIDLLLLTRVIEARVSEIFDAVKYLVSQNKYSGKLNGGYVLTGASAYLGYILPLAKTILGAKVRLAAPRYGIASDSETGAFDAGSSTSIGIILEQDRPILSTSIAKKRDTSAPAPAAAAKPAVAKPQPQVKDTAEIEEKATGKTENVEVETAAAKSAEVKEEQKDIKETAEAEDIREEENIKAKGKSKEGISSRWFGILRHKGSKSASTAVEDKPAEESTGGQPVVAEQAAVRTEPVKPVISKPETKRKEEPRKPTFFSELFSDDGNGNNA